MLIFNVVVPDGQAGKDQIKKRYINQDGSSKINWAHLAQDMERWRALVNVVMNLRNA